MFTSYFVCIFVIQIPKQAITAYVKHNKVPEVTSQLLYCKKGGSKLTWKEGSFFLRALGIYNIVDTKKASKIDLCSSLDHHVYTPMAVQGKGYETPNPFCFIMKVCFNTDKCTTIA